ncbi:hypothetical protein ACI65C_000592 [Semiaphis heraclei]
MEWTNDEILEFWELYEAQPAIWNPKNTGHRNRKIVHDAWKEIESKLSDCQSSDDIPRFNYNGLRQYWYSPNLLGA